MIQPADCGPAERGNGRSPTLPPPRNGIALHEEAQLVASRLLAVLRAVFMPVDDVAGELPLGQLRVCNALVDGPRSLTKIGKELGVSVSAMTQIADRLERSGLVKRVFKGTDRRVRCLQLTRRGKKVIRDRENARVQQISVVLNQLSPEVRDDVAATLAELVEACISTSDERRQLALPKRNGRRRQTVQ